MTDLLADPSTRCLGVRSLAYLGQPATIPALLSVIEDEDVTVRTLAIEALSYLQDPRVPEVLLRSLSDAAAAVRQVAVQGLGVRPYLATHLDRLQILGGAALGHGSRGCSSSSDRPGALGNGCSCDNADAAAKGRGDDHRT
ncbi:HEAT repeat domain-containing protein [Neosynechococcus sphagnicola]|uniref:HEAT repeat domain-containing protein n=1 Tax=Neosynechococcus sphagnicola TaxID=1501145 RepID=UPI0009DCE715|nr:HEAT repeat domain-containing protein [Neosynechococcus sphagnicola]